MKKVGFQITSPIGLTHILYPLENKDKNFSNDNMFTLISKDEFKMIKRYFNKYCRMLNKNSISTNSKAVFKKYRKEIEAHYFLEVKNSLQDWKVIFQKEKKDKKFRNQMLLNVIRPIFFFSDLSIAVLTGNPMNLKSFLKEHEEYLNIIATRKKPRLSIDKLKYKLEVIAIYCSNNSYTERRACKDIYDKNNTGYSELASFVASFRAWYNNLENQNKFPEINAYIEAVKKRRKPNHN